MKVDIKFIIALAAVYLLYVIQGGFIFTSLLIIFASMGVMSLLMTIVAAASLKSEMKVKKKQFTSGDRGEFYLTISNDSYFFMPFLRAFAGKEELDVRSASPRDATQIPFRYDFRKRGIYEFKDITLEIRDAFNIISTRRVFKREEIRVYPKLKSLNPREYVPGFGTMGSSRTALSKEDHYSQRELRRYSPGDSLRKVNWKVSAKYGEIFVKIGESMRSRDHLLLLDMSESVYQLDDDGSHEENLVSYALSVSRDILRRGYEQTFVINGKERKIFEINSVKDFDALMEYMVAADSHNRKELGTFLTERTDDFRDRGSLLIFTGSLSKSAAIKIADLKSGKNSVTVFTFEVKDGAGIENAEIGTVIIGEEG